MSACHGACSNCQRQAGPCANRPRYLQLTCQMDGQTVELLLADPVPPERLQVWQKGIDQARRDVAAGRKTGVQIRMGRILPDGNDQIYAFTLDTVDKVRLAD